MWYFQYEHHITKRSRYRWHIFSNTTSISGDGLAKHGRLFSLKSTWAELLNLLNLQGMLFLEWNLQNEPQIYIMIVYKLLLIVLLLIEAIFLSNISHLYLASGISRSQLWVLLTALGYIYQTRMLNTVNGDNTFGYTGSGHSRLYFWLCKKKS